MNSLIICLSEKDVISPSFKKKDISLDIKLCAEILGGALLCFLVCMVSKEKSSVILTSSYVISFFLNLTSFKSCLEQFEYDNMTHLCVFNFFLFFGGGDGIQ